MATKDELDRMLKEIVPPAVSEWGMREMEKRPDFRHVGVWKDTQNYRWGHCVTDGGSTWHCERTGTNERPGTGDDWTLIVKRGRDGK